ncbi:MAG: transposase [Betaproteobacteria bacterium]
MQFVRAAGLLGGEDAVALRRGLAGYNVQQAVDEHGKIGVSHEVMRHANDHRSLAPRARAAPGALGGGPLTVVADTGYMNGAQAQQCEECDIVPVVPMQQAASTAGDGFYPKTEFVYDPASDTYRCPAGAELSRFKRSATRQEDHYRTAACGNCAQRQRCTLAAQRTIACSWHAAAAERAAAQARDNPAWMRLRVATVEHPFGLLKAILPGGFAVRGLVKVKGEMALAVLVVNLRRAMNLAGIDKMMQLLQLPAPQTGSERRPHRPLRPQTTRR